MSDTRTYIVPDGQENSTNQMLPWMAMMKQRSLDIINSIETHQSIIKGCDEILQQLNPEIIEKQRQEQENKALREEINSLKEMFKEFINTSLKQEKHGNNN